MKKSVNKVISFVIVCLMMLEFCLSPLSVLATEKNQDIGGDEKKEIPKVERIEEKGTDYTVYDNKDGTKTIDYYTSDVRFKDKNGKYVDYDNSIEEADNKSEHTYENKEGITDVYFPDNLASAVPISISDKDSNNEVTFTPVFDEEVNKKETKAKVEKEVVEDIYEEKEEKNVKIIYGTNDTNIRFEYIPIENGVKENIILDQKPDTNIFSYEITCEGMIPKIPEAGGVIFYDKNNPEKEKGAILVPDMIDSSEYGAYSEDLEFSIEEIDKNKDQYKLILTVSEEYLNAKERVYPVTIDPTYTVSNTTATKDVYILSGHPTSNFYVSTIKKMPIGYGSTDKVCRTLMKFPELQKKIKGNYVSKATLKLTENSNGSPFSTVQVYRNSQSWALGEVTWNKRPDYNTSTVYASKKLTGKAAHTLNITNLAREWATGKYANYGLLLRSSVESSKTKNYNAFYGTRAASKKPVLSVTYTVPSPKPPSKASNVVNGNGDKTVYVKKGATITAKWADIKSNTMDAIQAKIVKFGSDNVLDNATTIKSYGATGSTAASGTYAVAGSTTSGWSEGRYGIGIRGLDKGGNKGLGTYCYAYVDNTAPSKVSNVTLTSSRESSTSESAKVKVSFKVGADLPKVNPSGIKDHTIKLYNEDGTQIGSATSAYKSVGGTAAYNITGVESGQKVYATVNTSDKAGNMSGEVKSELTEVMLTPLPEPNCSSGLDDNPWVNDEGRDVKVSWDTVYKDGDTDLDLGKITCNVINEDDSAIEGISETTITFDNSEVVPKKYDNFKVNEIFPKLNTLNDGKYKILVRFYTTNNDGYEEKEFEYNVDNIKPSAEITVPVEEDTILKQVAEIAFDAEDEHSGIGDKKIVLVDSKGKERVLTEKDDIYNFDTSNYDDGKYTVKVIVTDKAGNKTETIRNVIISNPPPTPVVSFEKAFGGQRDDITLNYNWIKGDDSVSEVDHIQYAIDSKDEEAWVDIDESNPNADENTKYSVKTAAIKVFDEDDEESKGISEGKHTFYFRAVDADGVSGKVRELKYTVDATAPGIKIDSKDSSQFIDLLFVSGKITDPNLARYDIYIASGESPADNAFKKVKTVENPKEKTEMSGKLAALDLSDDNTYPQGEKVTVKIVAKDTCFNESSHKFTTEKKDVIHHGADFSIEKTDIGTENVVLVENEKQKFNLKTRSNEDYEQENLDYFINSEKREHKENIVDFSDAEKYPDDSLHSIIARDNRNGEMKYSAPTYEYKLYEHLSLEDTTLDGLEKVGGLIGLSSRSTSGTYKITEKAAKDLPEGVLSLKLTADDDVPEGTVLKYELIINGKKVEVENNKEYYLGGTGENFISDSIKIDTLVVTATITGTSELSPSFKDLNLLVRTASGDILRVDMMNKWSPKNVTVESGLNYRTKVSWDTLITEENEQENITYEVHRSEGETFDKNNAKVVATGIKEGYWYDSYMPIDQYSNINNDEGIIPRTSFINDYEKDFSYKVVAVNGEEKTARRSNGTIGDKSSQLPALNEYTKRLGIKDYLGYFEFETPVSNGYVEQSMGNLVYTQADGSVKGKSYDIDMNRNYNSMSTSMTPLGIGWDFEFNHILLETYDEYGDSKGMVYKDGSGTIFNFLNIKNAPTKENIDEETGRLKSRETKLKSPFGVYIVLSKIEKFDIKDINGNGDYSEVIDVNYEMKTADDETITFDRNCHISSMEDRNGNSTVYRYFEDDVKEAISDNATLPSKGSKGLLREVETINGKSIDEFNDEYEKILKGSEAEQEVYRNKRSIMTFEYNDDNLIEKVNMPHDKHITYTYKNVSLGFGKTRKVLSSATVHTYDGNSISYDYGYSDGSNLSSVKDGEKNEYKIEYYDDNENLDMCKRITYPSGEGKSYIYEKADAPIQEFDKTIERTHKKGGIFEGEDSTVIGQSEAHYNKDGSVTYEKDMLGNETKTEFWNGLEVKSTTYTTYYDVGDNGVISEKTKENKTRTKYDSIPDNNSLAFVTETKGNVLEEISDNETTKYKYDENDDVISEETYIDGAITEDTEYTYDKDGNVLSEIEKVTGDGTKYTYDSDGNVIKETEIVAGKVTTITNYKYDEMGEVTEEKVSSASGSEEKTTGSEYDKFGRLIKETDAKGYTTEHEYDGYDREIKTIRNTKAGSAEGDEQLISETEYNNNGSVTLERKEDGSETSYTFDEMNRNIRSETTKNGRTKLTSASYSYADDNEREVIFGENDKKTYDFLYKVVSSENGIDTISYNDVSNRNVQTYSRGSTTYTGYDKSGNAFKTFSIEDGASLSDGVLTMNLNDDKGNESYSIQEPIYDDGDYRIDNENSLVTKSTYNKQGNKISETDPEGNKVAYWYSLGGRKSSITLPDTEKNITSQSLNVPDGRNTKTVVTNAKGNKAEEVYDAFGNTLEVRDIGQDTDSEKRVVTKYKYDENDNKVKETYSNGDYKNFTYNFDGDVIKEEHFRKDADKKEVDIEYSYDVSGNLVKVVHSTYQDGEVFKTRYTVNDYDGFGLMTASYEGEKESPNDSDKLRYEYNSKGELIKVKYPDSGTGVREVSYEYNNQGRVTYIRAKTSSNSTTKTVRAYEYSPKGNVSRVKDYTGFDAGSNSYTLRDYTYDKFDRPVKMTYVGSSDLEKVEEEYKFTYDKNGNILTEEIYNDYLSEAKDKIHVLKSYSYDTLGRLKKVTENDKLGGDAESVTTYSYDKVGNRLTETKGNKTESYTYNNLNELLEVKDGNNIIKEYTYDANGNTKKEVTPEAAITYSYDISNQLTKYAMDDKENYSNTLTQKNEYNYTGQRIKKHVISLDGAGMSRYTNNYHYDRGNMLYTTDENDNKTTENILNFEGSVISSARLSGNDLSFYSFNKDTRNSTTTLVDENNAGTAVYKYDEFGNTETLGNDIGNEVCYTGGINDKETGQLYLNARYYEPEDGRFITLDTYRGEFEEPSSLHLYAYCANDPLNYIDPSGHYKLNAKEKKLKKKHPIKSSICIGAGGWATIQTNKKYKSGFHNGNADAFRHIVWNFRMAIEVGVKFAKKWGNAHEYGAKKQPRIERDMDLYNNKVGLDLKVKYPRTRLMRTIVKKGISVVRSGKGRRISKKKLVKTNKKGLK